MIIPTLRHSRILVLLFCFSPSPAARKTPTPACSSQSVHRACPGIVAGCHRYPRCSTTPEDERQAVATLREVCGYGEAATTSDPTSTGATASHRVNWCAGGRTVPTGSLCEPGLTTDPCSGAVIQLDATKSLLSGTVGVVVPFTPVSRTTRPYTKLEAWSGLRCVSSAGAAQATGATTHILSVSLDSDSDGELACTLSSFDLSPLTHLAHLRLRGHGGLSGTLPRWLSRLPSLRTLDLSHNPQLSGYLPALSASTQLFHVHMSDCSLTGTIPAAWASTASNPEAGAATGIGALQAISLGGNQLSGTFPEGLHGLDTLVDLNVSHNRLSGHVSHYYGYTEISSLDLSFNHFSGTISTFLTRDAPSLRQLDMSHNRISGTIPPDLFAHTLPNLTSLSLQNNLIEGLVPTSISTLASLQHLNLSSNTVDGLIPPLPPHLQHASLQDNRYHCPLMRLALLTNGSTAVVPWSRSSDRIDVDCTCGEGMQCPWTSSRDKHATSACDEACKRQKCIASCTACPSGTWSQGDWNLRCHACGPGNLQTNQGQSQCDRCVAGSASNQTARSVPCESCQHGYYQPSPGQTECFQCAQGTYSDMAGSTECLECAAGHYQQQAGQETCTVCAQGMFQPVHGKSLCHFPDPGHRVVSNISQAPCPRGTWSATEGTGRGCIDCAAGYYHDGVGGTQCKACERGHFGAELGMSACLPCATGTATGRISSSSACAPCSLGQYQARGGQSECTACGPGTFGNVSGATSCHACDAGSYSEAAGLSLGCRSCAAGTFQPQTGSTDCHSCYTGTFQSVEGSTACRLCPGGTHARNTGQRQCDVCVSGQFRPQSEPGGSSCNECPAGFYMVHAGATRCDACAAGTFSAIVGSCTCQACEVGEHQSKAGQSRCSGCNEGMYSGAKGTSSCEQCAVGQFADASGQSVCVDCPSGKFVDVQGSIECVDCPSGMYGETGKATACDLCDPGQYSGSSGQTGCPTCTAGTFAVGPGDSECHQCAWHTYQSVAGQSQCETCPFGKYTDKANKECVRCPPTSIAPCSKYLVEFAGTTRTELGSSCVVGLTKSALPPYERASGCTCSTRGVTEDESSQVRSDRTECEPCPEGYIADQRQVACVMDRQRLITNTRHRQSPLLTPIAPPY